MIANREKGKGKKGIECPSCHNGMTAMTGHCDKITLPIPNRRYCFKCDKMFKFTMVLE